LEFGVWSCHRKGFFIKKIGKKERGIKAQFFKPFGDYHSSTLVVLAQIMLFF
jgi:hypothetical protein